MAKAKTLQDFDDQRLAAMPYADVKALRRAAAAAHVQSMPAEPRLEAWAARMTAARGPLIGLHCHGKHHETGALEPHAGLPWLPALLMVRYGEAPHHWPTTWNEEDMVRAHAWERGQVPFGVFDIVVEG